ncbi:MAG: hypothetical protein HY646_15150, partial [Acidobacteria bacterium]|nr:hypothetical protein [Acidobacteriota bacterium]
MTGRNPTGQRYEAEVPGTLDLSERARLAINAMTTDVNPQKDYDPYGSGVGNFFLTAKYLEALPMMRQMSGSEQNLDVEAAMMATMVRNIGDDGLVYCPNNSPMRRGGRGYKETDEDYNSPYASGRLILAMMAWSQRDGNAKWLELIKRQADGLRRIAIQRDDYAYYPDAGVAFDFAYLRRSGYVKTDEPRSERSGAEGTVKFYQANQVRALTRLYELTGDAQWLEFAGNIVRFMMKPQFWADDALAETVGTERAHWRGHFHGHLTAFRALLRYAVATDDQKLKEFVRAGYEYAHNFGIPCVGFFPGWLGPNPVGHKNACETCAISGMVALAIKLSDAGLGDYWDDLDAYVRNHLVESQYVDPKLIPIVVEKIRPIHRGNVSPTWYAQAWLGGFQGASDVTALTLDPAACCTGNGSTALFYAWEAALRHHDGVVEINLLLNRASPWLDVDGYLPYEGRVVLQNKSARTVSV